MRCQIRSCWKSQQLQRIEEKSMIYRVWGGAIFVPICFFFFLYLFSFLISPAASGSGGALPARRAALGSDRGARRRCWQLHPQTKTALQ